MDINALVAQYKWIVDIIAYLCLIGSAIVKVTPTLKDDNFLLPVIQFIGKWIALEKYGPTERPK
jgi:hypothetical protein